MKTPKILTKNTPRPREKVSYRVANESAYSSIKANPPRLMILSKQVSKKDGMCMIYVELTVKTSTPNGTAYTQKRLATGIRVMPSDWSDAKQEVKARPDHNATYLNDQLTSKRRAVEDFTKENIRDVAYLKSIPEQTKTYEKYFDHKHRKTLVQHLEDYIALRQTNSVRGTWKEFRTLKGRLENFEKYINKILYFEDINLEFAEKLKEWAKTVDLDPNTLKEKTIGSLKTFLNHYYSEQDKLNFILSDEYRDKKFSRVNGTHSSDPVPLYIEELEKLFKFEPKKVITFTIKEGKRKGEKENITLDAQYRTKQLFLLSCLTGLRYSDVTKLSKGNFKKETIIIRPKKTDNRKNSKDLYIPISPPVQQMVDEIKYDFSKIYITNQKVNTYLKEILKQLGIDELMVDYEYSLDGDRSESDVPKYELVSFHSGRDTFITNCLICGIDAITVMGWSGHSKFETFKKYIRLSENYLKTQHKKANRYFEKLKGIEPIKLTA